MLYPRLTRVLLPAGLAAILPAATSVAQAPPAFPGAEGFGAGATMQKTNAQNQSLPFAGEVYHVTSLADTNTPGTLRYGVRESGFPAAGRVIVFDVGGTIQLTASLDIKNVNGLYIAGQTAPSPVTIYGETSQITSSSGRTTQNVIVRNLAFRKGTGGGEDAITFAGSGAGTNLILDHVSASWAEDEILSVANNNSNVTVQYAMMNDALVSNHAYGSLIRPRVNSSVTFHHNLYAHNSSRQARFGTYDALKLTADFRNNVVYNWRDRASYAGGSSEAEQEFVDVNYVGNYLIAGPGTIANATKAFIVDKNVDVRAYQSGNFIDSDRQANPGGQPNGADTGWNMFGFNTPVVDQTLTQMASPFGMPAVATQSATDAYNQVLNHAGSSWWNRDAIDARVVDNVKTNTGPTIGAAAPNAAELNGVLTAQTTSRPAGWDTDNDGMPNAWETAHGLNPNAASPGDFDNDGYSNVEEYLNEAGAFPAPRAIGWSGGAAGRYALNGNWDTWQPSRFDTVHVSSGKAVVDAVGQHAGTLRVGRQVAAAEVEVTGGWLDVAGGVEVGGPSPGGAATLRLGGGTLFVGGALDLNATGMIALGGGTLAHNPAAPFNWNGGTLRTTVDQTIGLNATISTAGATLDTTDKSVTYTGSLAGPGQFTKVGSGTATLTGAATYTGGTNVQAGTLRVTRMHENNPVNIAGGKLKVIDSSPTLPAHPAGNNASVSRPSALNIANNGAALGARTYGGQLDLGNNDLILDYDGASPLEEITDMIRSGYAGGTWQGNGLTSSTANADRNFALAIADNARLTIPFSASRPFAGQTVDTSTILVKFTHRIDLDLDGFITTNDATIFNSNYNEGAPAYWSIGDLDYDRVFTTNDATIFNSFYNEALASVPEPAAGIFIVAGGLLVRRRVR